MPVGTGTFNKEKALVVSSSVIVKLHIIFGNLRLKLYSIDPANQYDITHLTVTLGPLLWKDLIIPALALPLQQQHCCRKGTWLM